ncbi:MULTISPECIES: acetyltransferase [Arthrobacter]|uniref:acetyltransferase n=1 Tax=unclassified Arthrobacter TaxID=235627 RepID=UPI0024BB3C9A|nr:acetyltransferase [Arthrobacter sp. H35-MC1]MDJ0317158.1 acetyltransferase [Arthrobacter sp. H35-MC1]
MTQLILVAASGLAREVLASTRASGLFDVVGYLDDDPELAGEYIDGLPVLGRISDATAFPTASFVLCAGKGSAREKIAGALAGLGIGSVRYTSVVDRTAFVSEGSVIGAGSILLANVVLTAGVRLGSHVVVMPSVTFTHDNEVDDFATLTAGVSLGGDVSIGRCAYLGMNSSVREGCVLGAGVTVGMGAVVLQDMPDDETWVGVPARRLHGQGIPTDKNSENGKH